MRVCHWMCILLCFIWENKIGSNYHHGRGGVSWVHHLVYTVEIFLRPVAAARGAAAAHTRGDKCVDLAFFVVVESVSAVRLLFFHRFFFLLFFGYSWNNVVITFFLYNCILYLNGAFCMVSSRKTRAHIMWWFNFCLPRSRCALHSRVIESFVLKQTCVDVEKSSHLCRI